MKTWSGEMIFSSRQIMFYVMYPEFQETMDFFIIL